MKALQTIKGWSTTTKVLVGAGVVGAIALAVYMFKKKAAAPADAKAGDKTGKTASGKPAESGKVPGVSSKGTAAATPDGKPATIGTTADGTPIVAPGPEATAPGEGSKIIYISPGTPAQDNDPSGIEVRTGDALFQKGALVQLSTANYNGQFTIQDTWDSGDGTGSVYLNTPYVDKGIVNSAGNKEDDAPGTIAVIGDPSAGLAPSPASVDNTLVAAPAAPADASAGVGQFGTSLDSFEGLPGENANLEFSQAAGKKPVKAGIKNNTHIRLIPASVAKVRIAAKKQGLKQGLKGAKLGDFVRKHAAKASIKK